MNPFPRSFFHRRPESHKGDYGHIVVVGGSVGLTGAPVMCALASLRAGAGLVSVAVPDSVYPIVAGQSMELMVHPIPDSRGTFGAGSLTKIQKLVRNADCLALGPGLSRTPAAQRLVRQLIPLVKCPIVLDADGIHAVSGSHSVQFRKTQGPIVMTPHPGEMSRLIGKSIETIQRNRLSTATHAAQDFNSIVVLKGHKTIVAGPAGQPYINQTGNPGMATAGMGDLLTGIIAAFIGQGLTPHAAAQAGVYIHGLAGDIAARKIGHISLIAGDILAALPEAFRKAAS